MHQTAASERVECGIRIDGVMGLQSHGVDRTERDAFMVVLDLAFELTDAPAGLLTITLAGGGSLRLSVEGLDLILADTGEPRRTRSKPDHDAA
jgi:hypothetical protein